MKESLKNKLDAVTNVFKGKSSKSVNTLGLGLLAAGSVVIHRAVSTINILELQNTRGDSEDEVNKQDLINLYDYVNKVTQEENYNIYADNLNCIKSKILECKPGNISDLLAEKFFQDGWDIANSDDSSLLTVAIEGIKERQKKNRDCDIQMAVSLILGMKKELIIGLENFADSNGKTLLHYLAESGREGVLSFVIDKLNSSGFNVKEAVRSEDRDDKTPLHYAANSGNKECFKILMENEAHFASTINYKSELHYAARSGSLDLLEYLKEILTARGIFEIEKIKLDKHGNNALHYAAQSGNAECIKFSIDNRVQFLKNQYNENPLHKIAGAKANTETQDNAINFFIEHLRLLGRLKSEITQPDVDGNTPLHIAAQHENKQLIEVFIRLGAKVVKNKRDNTPLHTAIIYGNADCIGLFIEKYENGGDSILESKGEYGRDLVHLAAMYGQFDCLDSLLKKFPHYDLKTKTEKENTALHLALSSNTETELRKKCVRLLIDRGIQVNESNNEGNTPLHFAAQLIDLKFLSMIEGELKKHRIDAHQEILRENNNDDTIFHIAARAGNKSCLEHLFSLIQEEEVGEILSKKNKDEQTLLHLSMLSGSIECAKYLIQKSQEYDIDIFSEQDTQKELLFAAILSGNEECLEFLAERFVDRNMADSVEVLFSHEDLNDNTPLHMAALADGIGCSQYIIESISKSIRLRSKDMKTLFKANSFELTPLHLAAMSLNAEVIEYLMTDNRSYAEKTLNIASKSGKTPLHYLVTNDDDFERIADEDFKQDQFLKNVILEKRKQNEHLREKAINALFYSTKSSGEKIVNEKIDFDIKDNAGKTALDYVLKHSNANVSRLFLDVFYEIKKDREKKYGKFKIDYQGLQKEILRVNGILAPITSVIIMGFVVFDQSGSSLKIFFTSVSIICCFISFLFAFCNLVISHRKSLLKNDIKNCTEKIDRIEEMTGKSVKTKVEVHNSEGYNTILEQLTKHAEYISQLESTLNKFMNAVDLKNRGEPSVSEMSSPKQSNLHLDIRRASGGAIDAMSRRDSRISFTTNKPSESKQKASQSKLKAVASKLKVANIFRKKENLVDTLSLLGKKNTVKRNEEEHTEQPRKDSVFSNCPNPSYSTSGEEFGTAKRAVRRVSYSSANKLPSVSEEGARLPSTTLSSPGAEVAIKELDCFIGEYRPRVQSSPPCMSKRGIAGRVLRSRVSSDHKRVEGIRIVVTNPDGIDFDSN